MFGVIYSSQEASLNFIKLLVQQNQKLLMVELMMMGNYDSRFIKNKYHEMELKPILAEFFGQ